MTETRPARSDTELRRLSEDVLYDVAVLFRTAARLERFATTIYTEGELTPAEAIHAGVELPWLERVAFIETFAIHARSLLDFLFREHGGPGVRATDVLATDFFRPGEWRKLCPPMEATLERVRERVGKEIVHITLDRGSLTVETKHWPFAQIAGALGRPCRVFIDHVEQERVIDGFREKIRAEFPEYLRYPIAVSWPRDDFPPPVGTTMPGPGGE